MLTTKTFVNTVATAEQHIRVNRQPQVDLSPPPPTSPSIPSPPTPRTPPFPQPPCKADLISAYTAHGALAVLLAAHPASLPGNTPGRRMLILLCIYLFIYSHSYVLVIETGDVEYMPKSRLFPVWMHREEGSVGGRGRDMQT